jgi:acetyl-CoA synthetase
MTRRISAHRQDDKWLRFVEELRSGPGRPFEEQWAVFQDIFAGRRTEDGPPPAWRPPSKLVAGSNLGRFMVDVDRPDYDDLHAWSVAHREEFWGKVIERLGIVFSRKPDAIVDLSGGPEEARWLPGATMSCVDSCFKASPDRSAIISAAEGEAGLRVTTYGQLEALVNRIAGGLRERGLSKGDGVALYMPMTVECVAAYLGVVRAGCRVVSIADSFSPAELQKRCRLGDARCVVTVEAYVRSGRRMDLYTKVKEASAPAAFVIPAGGPEAAGTVELRQGDHWWKDLLSAGTSFRALAADPEEVTNILFSSGTTGEPKLIPWTHLTPIKCAMDGHFHQDIHPRDVVAWPTNIGWMMGPWLIYASLINGATMALYEGAPTGPGFARFVRDSGVTMLGVVPSMVRAWRSAGVVQDREWEGVRVFSSTGEPSNREDYLWLMSRSGYRAPVIEYLGGTEIGGGHITGTVVHPASPATFTTAALGIDFVILDGQGQPAREGETGELYLIPPALGLSQKLLNGDHHAVYYAGCPTGPDGRPLRRHGDMIARLHDGYYKAQGRADDTMNLGGIKVSSLELEQVLNAHTAVYESAAVAVQPEGEGADRLVAFIVPKHEVDGEQLATDLQALLATRLNPLFRIHDLVVVEDLPRTASNKLMRRTLRARYLQERHTP